MPSWDAHGYIVWKSSRPRTIKWSVSSPMMGKLIFTGASSLPDNVIRSLARSDLALTASILPKKQAHPTNSNYKVRRTKILRLQTHWKLWKFQRKTNASHTLAPSCSQLKGRNFKMTSNKTGISLLGPTPTWLGYTQPSPLTGLIYWPPQNPFNKKSNDSTRTSKRSFKMKWKSF